MSTIVKYNDKHISPISSVSISHSMGQSTNGQCVAPTYSIVLNGYLLVNRGSPTSSGTFGDYGPEDCETIESDIWLSTLMAKHCAIGALFSENYHELEIGTSTGTPSLKAYPRVLGLNIDDTTNPQYFSYTIDMEADNLFCDGTPIWDTGCSQVKSYEESWDITYDEAEVTAEYGDNRLFKINHTISAVGSMIVNSSGIVLTPVQSAKEFVCSRSGLSSTVPALCVDGFSPFSGQLVNTSGNLYNYYESNSVDSVGGSYSKTENWTYTTTPYIEAYSVDTQESSDQSCQTVNIQGSVRGFEKRINGAVPASGSKFYNAQTRFDSLLATTGIFLRAEDLSGLNLDQQALSGTVSYNPFSGEITYNYSYKRMPERLLPSAKFEKVTVSNTWGEDIFAVQTILGRGEIIQPINIDESGNTTGHRINKTTLNIDAVYPCTTGVVGRRGPRYYSTYADELQAVVDLYNPTGFPECSWASVESQNEDWDRIDGSYRYSISWTWSESGVCN